MTVSQDGAGVRIAAYIGRRDTRVARSDVIAASLWLQSVDYHSSRIGRRDIVFGLDRISFQSIAKPMLLR